MTQTTVHYKAAIAQAKAEAEAMGHAAVGTQHLLLALLSDTGGLALQVLLNVDGKIPDLGRLREEVLAITNPETRS